MTDLSTQGVVPSSESYRFIPLNRGLFAIVDAGDFDWLNVWPWTAAKGKNGYYAVRRENGRVVAMHNVILSTPRGMRGDHWNGDTLDNRRCNIRIATKQQNAQNCAVSKNNRSGFTGVSFNKTLERWESYITVDGKKKGLGYFDRLDEAIAARKRAEVQYFGEIIRANCPARISRPKKLSRLRPQRVNNTSGFVGISRHRSTGKWMARVFTEDRTYYLGLFVSIPAALKAQRGFIRSVRHLE